MERNKARAKWHLVFYVLAMFDVAVVLLGLLLNHQIVDTFDASVVASDRWDRSLSEYLQLGYLATAANAPGNDVFATGDLVGEGRRLAIAVGRFNNQLKRVRSGNLQHSDATVQRALNSSLDRAGKSMEAMSNDAQAIFGHLRARDRYAAGVRMAAMDRHYGRVTSALRDLHQAVGRMRAGRIREQQAAVVRLRDLEYLLSCAVLVMVTGAVVYGRKIQVQIETNEHERESFVRRLQDAEVKLRAAHAELETKVEERTAELAQANAALLDEVGERVRAQQALQGYAVKLERSNRELQDFANVASHDLQEPLRKVQAFGDRLVSRHSDALNDEARSYVERMMKATSRMQTLINDLLSFSRVSTRARPFQPVDLNVITREVLSDLEVRIEQSGAKVQVEELPRVDADALQMRQLIQNLVGNALKFRREGVDTVVRVFATPEENIPVNGHITNVYSPNGHHSNGHAANGSGGTDPATSLNCSPTPEASDLTLKPVSNGSVARTGYCIHVQDNGIGFDEKYLDRIFTVFQRLHGRNEYEGSGVGLAVCRKIAERHGGCITARSAPGQGATFIVTLPKHPPQEGDPT